MSKKPKDRKNKLEGTDKRNFQKEPQYSQRLKRRYYIHEIRGRDKTKQNTRKGSWKSKTLEPH